VETVLARVRPREVSPARFLQLALLAVGSLYVVVATGAVVRLTASGLGCDNWPRCGDTPFPEKGGHAAIEFSNRVVALATMLVTLVAWLGARRTSSLPAWAQRASLAVFLGTVAQIPLGGLTVIFDLNPVLVMAHFLLAFAVLGVAVVVALEAWNLEAGRGAAVEPSWARWAAVALAGACLVLVVTGAFVTASGPHSGGEDIRRLGVLLDAVRIHVRVTAVFGLLLLGLGLFVLRSRARYPGIAKGGVLLLALLLVQMAVGEIQYRSHLPWWLVLVHVGLASAVWGVTVGLATAFWRPPAPLVRH
jgi:cytochrome c oxidase assembly protein subunit 15